MKKIWAYFKKKWGKSDLEIVLIMVIFAMTGFSFLFVKPVVFEWIGYHHIESGFLKVIMYILIMYPLYQVLLLIWGSMFGQFRFFWSFLGKMNKRLIPVARKQTNEE